MVGIVWRTGFIMNLNHEKTCLNNLWYSMTASQVSISARISGGSILNNNAFEGLSLFLRRFIIILQQPSAEERNSGQYYIS